MAEMKKTAEPAGELVRRLCQLKDESGRSLRELERATHASNSALSRYLSGQAAPPWTVVVALCREAGRDPRPLRTLWEEACEARRARGTASGGKAAVRRASVVREQAPEPSAARGRNDLPRDNPAFTARAGELAELTRLVRAGRVVAVDGMGGCGKTALAIRAAHQLSGEFGDCQIFLDLHGFTPGREPLEPGEALRRLLGAVGALNAASGPGAPNATDAADAASAAAERALPEGVEERAALWRAELAGRKAVVVLDNARDAAQIRPLMPGAGEHAVVVTSRRRLVDLDGVEPLTVGCLGAHEAAELFTRALESRAAEADPVRVDELMARCGRHPLAIRMTAARLKHRPSWSVAELDELPHEVGAALREIRDTSASVLGPEHRRLYRALLGRSADDPSAPGGAVDADEAGRLAQVARDAAARLLEDLVDVHLLEIADDGRYRPAFARLMRATLEG